MKRKEKILTQKIIKKGKKKKKLNRLLKFLIQLFLITEIF